MRQIVWAFGQSAIPALMPTCSRRHGNWCTELTLSGLSYIITQWPHWKASAGIALSPCKGKRALQSLHCRALPASDRLPIEVMELHLADSPLLFYDKLHPMGKTEVAELERQCYPSYPAWPLPFAFSHMLFKVPQQSIPDLGLAPTHQYPHRTLLGWTWPAPFLWALCVVPDQAPSVLSLAQQCCSPTN